MIKKCKRCRRDVDRSDAQKQFTILTIKRSCSSAEKSSRGYLCDWCTVDLDIFLSSSGSLGNVGERK